MSLHRRSAPGVPRRTSGRTVSKATPNRSRACMRKADRVRRPSKKELTMTAVLGIDIAKAKFQVSLLWADGRRRRKAFANTAAGCAELLSWLQRQDASRVHACLEATGTYGDL